MRKASREKIKDLMYNNRWFYNFFKDVKRERYDCFGEDTMTQGEMKLALEMEWTHLRRRFPKLAKELEDKGWKF